ncbi:3-ketosteroid-9-alpha-hydroxylase [Sinimarinibacterium sp. CAU 1509]|uniref:Rieske 2Fe-2S domain-containing protein n=1 Tax=Sinimarinibacterium sp. CAU 1509 TaxID=2562283 RepID=UPI0010ACCA18|nr:Rieske 2Fe-2S domain-containing protein [Sinimarinibacterium sp. CAU 1509]TJY58250.1 3-ketosteroid-9-alpha-hydroxylase [Sinimarinibacterium sp. CAU 1509]
MSTVINSSRATQTAQQAAYEIQAAPLPDRYARGWHCLGLASTFRDGEPHSVSAFGTRIVVFKGEDEQLRALNAWCPHMGADLGIGKVEGNRVVCRFHGWAFGGNGSCEDIPYSKTIPPKARVRSWPLQERNQLLFIWNDVEGNPPPPEQDIPQLPQVGSPEWSDWSLSQWVIDNNCRELVDNLSDLAHFGPVHGSSNVKYFANIFEGSRATQVMVGINERLGGTRNHLTTVATYFGPATLLCKMTGESDGMPIESILLVTNLPIDQMHFQLGFGVMVKRIPGLSEEQNQAMIKHYVDLTIQAFTEDVAVWHNKVRVDNPLLCAGDGPILQLRNWYSQFYTDADAVPADLAQRRVVEINLGLDAHPELQHAFQH